MGEQLGGTSLLFILGCKIKHEECPLSFSHNNCVKKTIHKA